MSSTEVVTTGAPMPVPDVAAPCVDIVVPVYNESAGLEPSVRRLHDYLVAHFPFTFRITIADNASTDETWEIAKRLRTQLAGVEAVRLAEKGRGRALRAVWEESDATVLAYMDVDLSTDLTALLPLVAPLLSGHSDVAIGSRLRGTARVVRGTKRELISRAYNAILRATLATGFSDAQCGFKAIRAGSARKLLPYVEDTGWFFDTELLVLAERAGLRIHEVPVDWTDDPDSRVDIVATALADLRGVARVARNLATGRVPLAAIGGDRASGGLLPQAVRFAGVGVVSTIAYLLLYVALRGGMSAQLANITALLVTTLVNTAVNRRFTFAVRGRRRAIQHQIQAMAVFGAAIALTSGALAALSALVVHPPRVLEVFVLVVANLITTVLRFVLLRNWVFRFRPDPAVSPQWQ
jgi:putative flippase GtrA